MRVLSSRSRGVMRSTWLSSLSSSQPASYIAASINSLQGPSVGGWDPPQDANPDLGNHSTLPNGIPGHGAARDQGRVRSPRFLEKSSNDEIANELEFLHLFFNRMGLTSHPSHCR
jgi:hypothetical protein